MKVLFQLLREFWLPLLLGIGWTAFNFADRPISAWTARDVLNVFGPTFFFMSWLVAQWYRVRKQQRVEEGLAGLQHDVRAIHSPLLPCGLFVTFKFRAVDSDLDDLFGGAEGFRVFRPDQPMPPPPVGLPPGMTDGRVIMPGRYLEYQRGVLCAAGFFKQDHPGYNTIHSPVTHTVASLRPDGIREAVQRNHPLLSIPSARVCLRLPARPQRRDTGPSLELTSVLHTHKIAAARAIDNDVFVDHVLQLVPEPAEQNRSWSVADLKGAALTVELGFFFIEPLSSLPMASWPVLHNLQLLCGPKGDKLLSFSLSQLSTQVVREDPNPLARGQAKCVQLQYECEIDEAVYSTGLLAAVTAAG